MKKVKVLILSAFVLIMLSACGTYVPKDEVITEKYVEKEEYYKSGKLYSNLSYIIKTNKRVYTVDSVRPKDVYNSYNVGDNLIFYSDTSYTILENERPSK